MSTKQPLLDLQFGLSQLAGNKELLDRMLKRFVDEFEHCAKEVSELVSVGQIKEAKLKVHTSKGISGNLGLKAFYECASDLDAELRNGQAPEVKVELFQSVCDLTCSHIKGLIDSSEEEIVAIPAPSMEVETAKKTLLSKLDRNEFIDDDELLTLVASLDLPEEIGRDVICSIEELKYPQAKNLINAN